MARNNDYYNLLQFRSKSEAACSSSSSITSVPHRIVCTRLWLFPVAFKASLSELFPYDFRNSSPEDLSGTESHFYLPTCPPTCMHPPIHPHSPPPPVPPLPAHFYLPVLRPTTKPSPSPITCPSTQLSIPGTHLSPHLLHPLYTLTHPTKMLPSWQQRGGMEL